MDCFVYWFDERSRDLHFKYIDPKAPAIIKNGIFRLGLDEFRPWFYVKKPSFVSANDFEQELRNISNVRWLKEYHKDGDYFNILRDDGKQLFYKIDADTVNDANRAFAYIKNYLLMNSYPKFECIDDFDDEVAWHNSENPFRMVAYAINASRCQYILSTRMNISICGMNRIDPKQHTIAKTQEDFDKYIKILSYDLETYTPNASNLLRAAKMKECEIMCIGVCFFMLSSAKPYRRICIISKPLKERGIDEYNDDDLEGGTEYIVVKNEKEILTKFIELIAKEDPLIICGFNNFGFDDYYLHERLELHKILNKFTDVTKTDFKRIEIRIDGIQQRDSSRTFIGNHMYFFDVMMYMLKSNPKLYSQKGQGGLNAMLEFNKIKSPYNDKDIIQKTGLDYGTMFKYWDEFKPDSEEHADEHDDENLYRMYDIAYYCMNDAFAAGLLLIRMGLLQDKIKLGELSCTSFSDSLYREVNKKVQSKIEEFAWKNDILLTDYSIFPRDI